jgi:hypothetical protein
LVGPQALREEAARKVEVKVKLEELCKTKQQRIKVRRYVVIMIS